MQDVDPVLCDVCGDNMIDVSGRNLGACIGAMISIESSSVLIEHPEIKKVQDTFGKTKFEICHRCWIKSLGVKPKRLKE